MRRGRFTVWVVLAAAGFSLLVGVPGAATAGGGSISSCLAMATGTVTFQGSGVLGHRTGHQQGAGVYFACHTADPSIHSGSATFDSNLTLDCLTMRFTDVGTYTIRWDNGRDSVIDYMATSTVAAVAPAIGRVVSGEFVGQSTSDLDLLAPLDPRICTENQGSVPGGGVGLLTLSPGS